MSAQLALGYSPSYAGGELWNQRLEILRLVVKHLSLKEVAFALDVGSTFISDALLERDRKRWAAEWNDVVKQMLLQRRDETSLDLYRQLCELDVYSGPFAIIASEELTAEQEAAELRRQLIALGDKGRAAASKVPRGVRR